MLSDALGVSGGEHAVSQTVMQLMREVADDVESDVMGNVWGHVRSGRENAPKIMLCAHIDQIGFMVTEITKEGFLRFISMGVDPRMLLGSELWVLTQNHGKIKGIVASVPPHLQGEGDQKKAPAVAQMTVDIGMTYEQAVKTVSVGDYMCFAGEVLSLGSDVLCGKSFDDRACLVGILKAGELIKGACDADVILTASVKEEVGGHGAQALAHRHKADLTIVFDVCHGKTSDSKPSDRTHDFGGGPLINVGYCSRPHLFERAKEIARAKEIPHQVGAFTAFSGTDADSVYQVGFGLNTLDIGLPLKYMHSPVEMLKLSDVENSARLLAALCQNMLKEGFSC